MPHFIDVLLPLPLRKTFCYSVSEQEFNFLSIGMRVSVPFGKKKIYTGLVWKKHQKPPIAYEAKEIDFILDQTPIITSLQLQFWQWISSYYMCTLGEVMRTSLPSWLLPESNTQIFKLENTTFNNITSDEALILEKLKEKNSLKIQEIASLLNHKKALPILQKMSQKKWIGFKETVSHKYKPKLSSFIRLHKSYQNPLKLELLIENLGRSPKQKQVLLAYFTLNPQNPKPIKKSILLKQQNVSASAVKSLISKGVLEVYTVETDRLSNNTSSLKNPKPLSDNQRRALLEIKNGFQEKNVALLHGVTSSGKTEIYIHLIAEAIALGKQVLYLLPEIALSIQLMNKLIEVFGDRVLVFHSRYSMSERIEMWHKLLHEPDKYPIVLGARSALLMPFQNLGLILVDEEHEQSFKQAERSPRYMARDAAVVLAEIHQAKTLLGSATPSLESYNNAKKGKYTLVNLTERFGPVSLPKIELINLKLAYKKKQMRGHFSLELISEIKNVLDENAQIILFQNRRGFSPIVECMSCGHIVQCTNCDVSLTYHKYRNQVKCHYCGFNKQMEAFCEACDSNQLNTKGVGTEQIEEELKVLFPHSKIARMDYDSTKGKYGYQKLITQFEEGETDILIGTQMVTKGLHFKNVRLVGVINADSLLYYPDFRSFERSFQLLSQVAGRAGRYVENGKVLIQTYSPNHRVLEQVIAYNYTSMFENEIRDRATYLYPPCIRLFRLSFKHKSYPKIEKASQWFANALVTTFGKMILGPESPPIPRIRGLYIKQIFLKIPKNSKLLLQKQKLERIRKSFEAISEFRSIKFELDIDPY